MSVLIPQPPIGDSARRASLRIRLALCVVTLILVVAALWPFNPFPKNQLRWLQGQNGVRFGQDSIIFTSRAFDSEAFRTQPYCALEIWLEPEVPRVESSGTILSFYTLEHSAGLRLRQHHDDFLVQWDLSSTEVQRNTAEVKIGQAFRRRGRILFTITMDGHGTSVFEDGQFAESNTHSPVTCESLSGTLVLGNSAAEYDSWQGSIFGLALYRIALTPQQARRNSAWWTEGSHAVSDPPDGLLALYSFSERGGSIIHELRNHGPELRIPSTFTIPYKRVLTAPWNEFSPTADYAWDAFINFAGFIPFGFLSYAWFRVKFSQNRAATFALALGVLLSLSFELLQGLLPTRSSGMTDILTNTLGTAGGILFLRCRRAARLLEKFV